METLILYFNKYERLKHIKVVITSRAGTQFFNMARITLGRYIIFDLPHWAAFMIALLRKGILEHMAATICI